MPLAFLGAHCQALVGHIEFPTHVEPLSIVSLLSGLPPALLPHVSGPLRVMIAPHGQPGVTGIALEVSHEPRLGVLEVLLDPLARLSARVLYPTARYTPGVERLPPRCQVGQGHALQMAS